MKTSIKSLKKIIKEGMKSLAKKEDVDRVRRHKDGYGESDFEEGIKLPFLKDKNKKGGDGCLRLTVLL